VTNVAGVGAVEVARAHGIPVIELPSRGRKREEHEQDVLAALKKHKFEWIVLAGYMRLFSADFVRSFWDERLHAARMINIHPSLLPSFPGTGGYAQALRHGVKVTGATVHLVTDGLDDGPIVAQRALEIRDDDTEESLTARGLALEHGLYVDALADIFTRPWSVVIPPSPTEAPSRPRVEFRRPS
jgi:phosphoribosylglycinamide formyltransferase-1